MFCYSIDAGDTETCRNVTDSTTCSDDDYDTYFELDTTDADDFEA
jgi:hypothetical protein